MKILSSLLLIAIAIFLNSCKNGQAQNTDTNLSETAFAEKLSQNPSAPILDVRTPEEFSKGHLQHAINYDWSSSNFQNQIANLDKNKPVFVYCLSGSRSQSAADEMRSLGFKEVYELKGGFISWRAANLPEAAMSEGINSGLTMEGFQKILASDKTVLVDFYADWCAPCKKMKPYIDEISTGMSEKVVVTRINVDDHPELCRQLQINEIPVLQIYKNQKLAWTNKGFIGKEEVLQQLQ